MNKYVAKGIRSLTHFSTEVVQDVKGHDFLKNLSLNLIEGIEKTVDENQAAEKIKKNFTERVHTQNMKKQPAKDEALVLVSDAENVLEEGQIDTSKSSDKRKGF